MCQAQDKEKNLRPWQDWNLHDLPNTGRALYPLSYRELMRSEVNIWHLSCILLINNVEIVLYGERNKDGKFGAWWINVNESECGWNNPSVGKLYYKMMEHGCCCKNLNRKKDFLWKIIPKQFDTKFFSHNKFGCSLLRCYRQALPRIAILKNFHLNEATLKKFSPNFPTQNKFLNQIFQMQRKLFYHFRHLKSTVPLPGLGNVLLGELRWGWTTTTTTFICRP